MKRVRVIHQQLSASAAPAADEATPILKGIKVVELATVIAAPSCAAVLADFGAEVTKIEAPGGDMWRAFGASFGNENRGKKSVVIDIKQPEQLAVLKAMLADSDVFVTNVRGAPLKRAGLDYETIHAEMPQLSKWARQPANPAY
jgi:crotonobetainyl-CoA:carnitine CoA-transferase CaiB-like acyl-CoA transferase